MGFEEWFEKAKEKYEVWGNGDDFYVDDEIKKFCKKAWDSATDELKANADYQIEGRELEIKELKAQIEKMKKYIKACWVEENLNDYSSYITNTSDEFIDLVKELNAEVRNGR